MIEQVLNREKISNMDEYKAVHDEITEILSRKEVDCVYLRELLRVIIDFEKELLKDSHY